MCVASSSIMREGDSNPDFIQDKADCDRSVALACNRHLSELRAYRMKFNEILAKTRAPNYLAAVHRDGSPYLSGSAGTVGRGVPAEPPP